MRSSLAICTFVCLGALALLAAAPPNTGTTPQPPPPPQPPTPAMPAPKPPTTPAPATQPAVLSDFAWLEGRWMGETVEGRMEDIWSGIDGGTIMGMFRLVLPNQSVNVLEMSVLRQDGEFVVLDFRHFTPSLSTWESSRNALELYLAEKSRDRIVWQNPNPADTRMTMPHRVTWTRTAENHLHVSVDVLRNAEEKRILECEMIRVPVGVPPTPTSQPAGRS